MKKAVMYGGGNIGRGFIGATFSQSGYEVTFVDVMDTVVNEITARGEYPVRYVSADGNEDVIIRNVTAQNGNDRAAVARCIAECDIMATAVGARILPLIAGNLVAGLRLRWATHDRPLNIIICENLMDANKVLEELLKSQLTEEEQHRFDRSVGLVEASIGRMVPVQTEQMKDGDTLRVCVEPYGFLPVDLAAFKGEVPEIRNMVPFTPFDFYIKRKLYVHNLGHATCAYLGDYLGLEYIYQSIDEADVHILVQNAMQESAQALSKKYNVPLQEIELHITDLLGRFTNAALMDTCQRVGGDPARKLGPEDRLIGASKLALECGVIPAYIAVGAAGAVYRYIREAGNLAQSMDTAAAVLKEVAGIKKDANSNAGDGSIGGSGSDDSDRGRDIRLAGLILNMYQLFIEGKSVADIRRAAGKVKAASLSGVI